MNDASKSQRQEQMALAWSRKTKGRGCLIAVTGFGKTQTALFIIQKLLEKKKDLRVLIVVPQIPIQNQWIKRTVNLQGVNSCLIEVLCFNSFWNYKKPFDFLIVDEVHLAMGDETWNAICSHRFRYFLGLTATPNRSDKREEILFRYFPIADIVTREEAIENGWVNNFVFEIEKVVPADKKKIDDLSTFISINTKRIGNYIDVVQNPKGYSQVVTDIAFQIQQKVQERRFLIAGNKAKLDRAENYIRHFKHRRMIVFFEFIEHMQEFEKRISDLNVRSIASSRYTGKIIQKKTKWGAIRHEKEKKSISKKKREQVLQDFSDGFFNILLTTRVLDLGADIPNINLGIIVANSSNPTQISQRLGRIMRYDGNVCQLIQLVCKDTIDERWQSKSGKI